MSLQSSSTVSKKRYFLVFGTFFISVLLYVDRACISSAKDAIATDLALNDLQMGWVLSIFTLGYALFQTPSGWLADRLGPRRVLSLIIAAWSLFTALTGLVRSFVPLLLVRFLFGVGEAGAFPGMARAIYSWIPRAERGLVKGINFSGSRLGAAFALPVVAWMIQVVGWQHSFVILGGVGVLFALCWWWAFRDDPAAHPAMPEAEVAFIHAHRQEENMQQADAFSWKALFASGQMWMLMLQYFCSNFTFFFTLTWLFPHIRTTYQLEMVEAGWYASLPLLAGAAGNWFSGWLVDALYRRGQHRRSRAWPAMAGFALAAVGLVASLYMDTALGAVLCLSLAIFGADMTLSPSWVFCIDIGRSHAGTVSGTMNMAGNLGAFVTSLAFPYLKALTGSVTPFFFLGAGLNLLALWLWSRMKPQ